MFSGESTVTATTKRELKPITDTDGISQVDDATVVGIAERTLNNDGLGQQLFSDDATVVGLSERIINAQGALQTGESSVSALGEREHDFESGIAQVDDATVSGISERTVNLLDGIGAITDTYFGPSTSDGYVSYSGNDVIVSGVPTAGNDGTYLVTPLRS